MNGRRMKLYQFIASIKYVNVIGWLNYKLIFSIAIIFSIYTTYSPSHQMLIDVILIQYLYHCWMGLETLEQA